MKNLQVSYTFLENLSVRISRSFSSKKNFKHYSVDKTPSYSLELDGIEIPEKSFDKLSKVCGNFWEEGYVDDSDTTNLQRYERSLKENIEEAIEKTNKEFEKNFKSFCTSQIKSLKKR